MTSRILPTLGAVAAAAALVLLPTGGAEAAGSCTLTSPSQISITANLTALPANLSGDCLPDGFARWETEQLDHYATVSFSDEEGYPDPLLEVPDYLDYYGQLLWVQHGAGSADFDTCSDECFNLEQNEPVVDIRLGVAPWLTGTRTSSTKVTLNVTSNVWSPARDRFYPKAMNGELQIQNANGTWSRLGSPFTTYSTGKRTVVATVGGHRNFRYAMYSTGYSWSKVSTVIAR